MKCLWIVLLILLILAALLFLLFKLFSKLIERTERLPLHLMGFGNIPAVPIQIRNSIETLLKLAGRSVATEQAQFGFSERYTISGENATGYQFMYGTKTIRYDKETTTQLTRELQLAGAKMLLLPKNNVLSATLTKRMDKYHGPRPKKLIKNGVTYQDLFLDKPEQFAISWTNFYNIYEDAQEHLPTWAASLTDVAIANREFWPTIAQYGLAYNLLIAQKVSPEQLPVLKAEYGANWTAEMDALSKKGLLYAIDMTIYKEVEPSQVEGFDRFTPSTYTLLEQDASSKNLSPIAIWVEGYKGKDRQFYSLETATKGAWLYALQAAKVSITVHGIWSGHVYHWHIVTAAMQMYMYESFKEDHPIYELLQPISNYLIPFDNVLLLLWNKVAPPTSISTTKAYLEFTNIYAKGRNFFDDDPINTLQRNGIQEADFSVDKPWDAYQIVAYELDIWKATEEYIIAFVEYTYTSDQAVQNDKALQDWIKACGAPLKGNIRGLPIMDTKEALIRVLTSFVYRITVHGSSRLIPTANPALTFVGNFPPCLQRTDRPEPSQDLPIAELMTYLPNTGTIGEMMNFYNTFSFSAPYETVLPLGGIERDLFFNNEDINDPRNQALIKFRKAIKNFMDENVGDGLIHQWPLNIET